MPNIVRIATKIYRTKLFSEVWKDYDAFKDDYNALAKLVNCGTAPFNEADVVKAIYYLLYARYGNSPIICTDEMAFKMKVFTILCTYGPTWYKKKGIQTAIRALSEADIQQGSKQIYNHAFNPSTEPSTAQLDELTHINDQNVSNNKKAKLEAYSILWANLHVDATEEFINKFNKTCFSKFVGDQMPIIYVTEEEEGE